MANNGLMVKQVAIISVLRVFFKFDLRMKKEY